MAQAPTVSAPTARGVALAALSIALGYAAAGTHEQGGNNRGDQVEFFQHLMGGNPGDPWCADFVSTCLVKGFARKCQWPEDRLHLLQDVGIAGHLIPLSGYCPALWHMAVAKGFARGKGFSPVAGDLVLFDFEDQGEPHHVGFIRSADAGAVRTVEGNTSSGEPGSQADGDGVYCRTRDRSHVFGLVHF